MNDFSPMEIKKGNKRMAKKPAAPIGIGHNGSGFTPDQESVFIRETTKLAAFESAMAKLKGDMSACYGRLEAAEFTKKDVAWLKTLQTENLAKINKETQNRIGIARLQGHPYGRQFDMFEADRTPLEDVAFLEGTAAGKFGTANANPYGMETISGQRWQEGFNEGNIFRNKALNEALNGEAAAEIIKAPDNEEDGSTEETGEAETAPVEETPSTEDEGGSTGGTGSLGAGDDQAREEVSDDVGPAESEDNANVVPLVADPDDNWDNDTPPPRAA